MPLIFFSFKMFSFLNLENDMHTDAPKAFATYSLKTSEIRTTNQLQPIVSTTGNTTTSHVSTFSNNTLHSRPPMTSMSSTKTNTSFLPKQSQSIPFGSITSSKQNSLATVLSTLLYTTSGNDKTASSISLTQSCIHQTRLYLIWPHPPHHYILMQHITKQLMHIQ